MTKTQMARSRYAVSRPLSRLLGADMTVVAKLAAAVVTVFAATLFATTLGAQSIPRIPFEKYTLPNGFEVILHQDHTTPMIAVDTWYHVGSGDEKAGHTGFAHLFEQHFLQ